jgi:hypothetical protein
MVNETFNSQMPTETITPWEWRTRLTCAVLGSFSLSDDLPEQIPTDLVYSSFQELKQRYPKWLGSLHFQTSKYATVCVGLEDSLFYLGAFGLVTVENRDFRCLRFSSKAKAVTKDKVKQHLASDSSIKELEDLSNDFAKLINSGINACTE